MKKILLLPVKNEEWILEKTLAAAESWADIIVIADQNSDDNTEKIAKSFKKVFYIKNNETGLRQSRARQLLLNTIREKFGQNNIIFCLDADEILSENACTDKDFWKLVEKLQPGQSLVLQWVMLWKSLSVYRDDNSIWSNNWKNFIFRDNGEFNYEEKNTSEPRMPEKFLNNCLTYKKVKVLHFEFFDWNRMLSKQRRYRVMDYLSKPTFLNAIRINRMYWETKNEQGLKVSKVLDLWLGSQSMFKFLSAGSDDGYFWYDSSVVDSITKYGASYFKWLDIWDVDWQNKRQLSMLKNNFLDHKVTQVEIVDPRNVIQKFYHKIIQRFLKYGKFILILKRFVKKYV